MAAKVPAPKMQIRAIFSLVERLRIPSVLIGKAKIQMSVTMLIPEVALYRGQPTCIYGEWAGDLQ